MAEEAMVEIPKAGNTHSLAAMMRHLSARQSVIAQNIVHADTPGYRTQDLARPDFASLLRGESGNLQPHVVRQAGETRPDGNNVSIEQQLLSLGEVRAEFGLMTQLYRKQISLMRTAIKG